MFFCRLAYSFPAPLHLSFCCFSVLIIAFASSSLFPSPHSIYVFVSPLLPPSLPPSFPVSSQQQQQWSTTSCDRIAVSAHAPDTSQVHYICTQRPSLVAPHTAYVPAKCNVTAPPQPSFTAITGQISPSQAPVCSLIDGTPAFLLARACVGVVILRVRAVVCVLFGSLHSSVSPRVLVFGAGLT